MIVESTKSEALRIDEEKARALLERDAAPCANGQLHDSLRGAWWACEFYPKRQWHSGVWSFGPMLARRRAVRTAGPGEVRIHESVFEREGYEPPLSREECEVEPWVRLPNTPPWPGCEPTKPDPATLMDRVVAVGSVYLLVCLFLAPISLVLYLWQSTALPTAIIGLTPFYWVPSWTGLGAALLWPVAFVLGVMMLEKRAPTAQLRQKLGEPLLHRRLGFGATTAKRVMDRLGVEGRASYAKALSWDFLFILFYGAAFVGAWALTWTRPWSLLILAGAAILADVVENSVLLSQLRLSDGERQASGVSLTVAGLATFLKLALLTLAVAGLELCLLSPAAFLAVEGFVAIGPANFWAGSAAVAVLLGGAAWAIRWANRRRS